jgi:hypothetical protein
MVPDGGLWTGQAVEYILRRLRVFGKQRFGVASRRWRDPVSREEIEHAVHR